MTEKMTERQMLQYAIESGIIDINTLQTQIEMNERKKYLEMHQNKVWKGSNGYYYTKVEDRSKKDGRRMIKKKTFQEMEDEIVEHYKSLENEPTIEYVFQNWIEKKLNYGEIQKQTVERYEMDFKRFFAGTGFSKRKIQYLQEYELEDFIKLSICNEHLSAKAWGNLRIILKGIFKYAKKMGYTDISITSFLGDVDISKKSFTRHYKEDSECVFNEQEISLLVKYLSGKPTLGNLGVLVAAYTGMRVGEVVGLKWSDIAEDSIYVHRTQIRYKGEDGKEVYEIRDTPKTEAGIRHIVMVDGVKKVFRVLRTINPFTEYIFQKGDKVLTKTALESCLYRACERIGIPRRSMHSLRKTYATRLINSHIDDAIIINQMGHTDIETTRNYYYFNDKSFDTMRYLISKAINY